MRTKSFPIRTLLHAPHRRIRGAINTLRLDAETEMSLSQALARWARRRGTLPCLHFEGRSWSYGELDALVDRRAANFSNQGLKKGDAVSMMMDNRPEFIISMLAFNRLGVVPAFINVALKLAGLRHAVLISNPVAALVGGEHLATFREAFDDPKSQLDIPVWVDWEGEPDAELQGSERGITEIERSTSASPPAVSVRGDDLCAYIYTSGTTGLPKASRMINARCVMAAEGWGALFLSMGPGDVMYCCLPMFHSNAFLVALSCTIWNGAAFALARRFSATNFWGDIREMDATFFAYIGEICRYLMGSPPVPTDGQHRLRGIIGNGMRPEIWPAFVERFNPGIVHEFYGSTEGNVNLLNVFGREGSVGKLPFILDNSLLVKLDPDTREPLRNAKGRCIRCKRGEVGELLGRINKERVTQRFEGYADSNATESKIVRDVRKSGDAYFRTGDLLKRDWLGHYYFVDRVGDTFRWKGENVSTAEVGETIHKLSGAELTNVYGIQIPGTEGRVGMAALVLGDRGSFDPVAFYSHVERELPAYARPAFVRLPTQMALTATLKLRKDSLVKDGFDPSRIDDPLYYRDDAARCYKVLDAETIEKVIAGQIRF